MAIEIVDFPMKNRGPFQFAMLNYQRVESPKDLDDDWRILINIGESTVHITHLLHV